MTAQVHETLILDGQETSMAFCPPLPEQHPRIIELDPNDPQARRADSIIFSTACWRGYLGTWEIRDGRFYLVALAGRLQLRGEEPLAADWFSGVLRIPRGEMLQYVHMGFGSVFEEELHIRMEAGKVVSQRVISNRSREFDEGELTWRNLPGMENSFPGDDEQDQ